MTQTSSPRTRVFAVAMILAPILLLLSTLAHSFGKGLGEDATGGAIQVYAMVAFALAIVGLTSLLEPSLSRLSAVLTVTGLLGVAGGVGFGIDSIVFASNPTAAASELEGSTAAGLALFLPGTVFPLTLIVLGLALAKTGVVPRPAALALALGGLLFPLSRIPSIEALAVASDLMLITGLVPIGLAVWSTAHRSESTGVSPAAT